MIQAIRKLFAQTPEPCPSCELRRIAMISSHDKLVSTQNAYAGLSRRVTAFQKDHPELWRLYFTKAGDAQRMQQKAS